MDNKRINKNMIEPDKHYTRDEFKTGYNTMRSAKQLPEHKDYTFLYSSKDIFDYLASKNILKIELRQCKTKTVKKEVALGKDLMDNILQFLELKKTTYKPQSQKMGDSYYADLTRYEKFIDKIAKIDDTRFSAGKGRLIKVIAGDQGCHRWIVEDLQTQQRYTTVVMENNIIGEDAK